MKRKTALSVHTVTFVKELLSSSRWMTYSVLGSESELHSLSESLLMITFFSTLEVFRIKITAMKLMQLLIQEMA